MASLDILVHLGAALFLIGFVVRDQILLRALIILGTISYIIYYLLLPTPLWSALAWNAGFVIINLIMIIVIYADRARFSMSPREEQLYALFNTLTPGEFRKLMKAAEWFDGRGGERLTVTGEVPERLYFILEGQVEIERDNATFNVGPGVFIGELAYLMRNPATANVTLLNQTTGLSWSSSSLAKTLAANPQMKIAFDGLLNRDLASKLAQ